MKRALAQAKIAFDLGEVPIGAVLVLDDQIISEAYNQVETSHDASAHAEMICLRKASAHLSQWRLSNAILYSTIEPCGMCAAALYSFRVAKIIWGAKEPRMGAAGSLFNFFSLEHPIHRVQSEGGLLEDECSDIIREFFKLRRRENNSSSAR